MKSLIFVIVTLNLLTQAKKTEKSLVESVKDHKDLKKVLRTKNNVLSIFYNNLKKSGDALKLLDEVSIDVKGLATILSVDCSDKDGKKLCKKLKIPSDKNYVLKHYKDGDFHKDYDRALKAKSMVTFLKDPFLY